MRGKAEGFTLVELVVSFTVLIILSLAFSELIDALFSSSDISQAQAVAATLASNQMEYVKSLPYSNMAVTGGPIEASTTIPGTVSETVDGQKYTVKTLIQYVDDAFDGCGSYPTLTLEKEYCRNYPPPSGAPSPGDTDDYKEINVTVLDSSGLQLAELDSEVAPLVAETPNTTGGIFVQVVDNTGEPVVGATVTVVNTAVSPAINVSDTTDDNGEAIFYQMTPDSNYDYVITASDNGYSSLTTIANSGSLVATYPNQKVLTQASSSVTMMIEPEGQYSLLMHATTTSGTSISGAKIYVKGGYKKYTSSTDTTYYYDTVASNNSPTTDASGYAELTNLVPGSYIFCGDAGATSCSVSGTTYYLAAAVPYGGSTPLQPILVPTYDASNPPTTTYPYGGNNYLQEVDLILTPTSGFPRIQSISPGDGSLSAGLSNLSFTIVGVNLPCSATASSCSTSISFLQGSSTFPATCTGSSAGVQLKCTVNLSSASVGVVQIKVTVGSYTMTLPASPLLGGLIIDQ